MKAIIPCLNLILIVLTAQWSFAADFKVSAPKSWKRISQTDQGALFRNSASKLDESIVIQSFALSSQNQQFQESLPQRVRQLESSRNGYLRAFGLANYSILDIELRRSKAKPVGSMIVIQSRYRGLDSREVQMLERQFILKKKMYVVTYLVNGPALPNRERAETYLNFFEPIPSKDRTPASEILVPASGATVENSAEAPDTPRIPTVLGLDMSKPENIKRCERVPADKRRTIADTDPLNELFQKKVVNRAQCFLGAVVDNAWDFSSGLLSAVTTFAKYNHSHVYRDQVHAAAAPIIAELFNTSLDAEKRMVASVWQSMLASVDDFACLKPSLQTRIICQTVAGLFVSEQAILSKLLTLTKLTPDELAKVSQRAIESAKAVGVEKTQAGLATNSMAAQTADRPAIQQTTAAQPLSHQPPDAIRPDELVSPERFGAFHDGLTPDQFSAIIRGSGRSNDPKASTYIGDGLNHSPKPGTLTTANTRALPNSGANPLQLITREQYNALPSGTVLESAPGRIHVKGDGGVDLREYDGFLRLGFRRSNLNRPERYVGEVSQSTLEELKKLREQAQSVNSSMNAMSAVRVQEARSDLLQSGARFAQQKGSQDLGELARTSGYNQVPVMNNRFNGEALTVKPGEQVKVMMRYRPRGAQQAIEVEGTTLPYSGGPRIVFTDSAGKTHVVGGDSGTIESIYAKKVEAPAVVLRRTDAKPNTPPQSQAAIATNEFDREVERLKPGHDRAVTAWNNSIDTMYSGSTSLHFSNAAQKSTFFEAAKKMRQQSFSVSPTRSGAIEENIQRNRLLGRTPQRIEKNGIPVYAPGQSYFRAMVVKPDGHAGARAILDADGWKSGAARGVNVDPAKLGTAGNGATRLNQRAPFEDAVVEFVVPKANVGPGFEEGFSFPRDSRVVGIGSSSAVVDVALKTAGQLPEGSFLMVTETIARNKPVVNSQQLFDGRNLRSKYPLVYEDGGVEHAVPNVETNEIVNVIFIPINEKK